MLRWIILTLFFVATTTYAKPNEKIIKESRELCGDNQDCISLIAIELNDSKESGAYAKRRGYSLDRAIKNKKSDLKGFCDNSPAYDICDYYKFLLMKEFYEGYQGN